MVDTRWGNSVTCDAALGCLPSWVIRPKGERGKAMTDEEYTLNVIRESLAAAKSIMEADTDHPRFCVVPNRVILRLAEAFDRLDEGLLTAQYQVPREWSSGCPWAPGGEAYDGTECPQHKRVHSAS